MAPREYSERRGFRTCGKQKKWCLPGFQLELLRLNVGETGQILLWLPLGRGMEGIRDTRTALGWGWFLLINVCSSRVTHPRTPLPWLVESCWENEHFPRAGPQEATLGSQGGSLVGGVTQWIPHTPPASLDLHPIPSISAPALHRKNLIHSSVPQVHSSYL